MKDADGILVPGGFGDRGIEGKIAAIEYARVNKVPFLGICLGMQLASIEYARNVLNYQMLIQQKLSQKQKILLLTSSRAKRY